MLDQPAVPLKYMVPSASLRGSRLLYSKNRYASGGNSLNYNPCPSNLPLRWMIYHLTKQGARFSFRGLVGDPSDPQTPWNALSPAPFYVHLLGFLERKKNLSNSPMTEEKQVQFIIRYGAVFDALDLERLQELAREEDPSGAQDAARSVLKDVCTPLKSTSKAFHVLACVTSFLIFPLHGKAKFAPP